MVAFGALQNRFDPNFYRVNFQEIVKKITKNNFKKLSYVVHFSSETWNGKDFFEKEFPYIEISEINLLSGKINHISNVLVKEAPSRAKMIVRNNDIIVSTTRPSRGAISHIELENDAIQIASTGFSVLRNLKTDLILKEYLFYCLRQEFSLKQMEQRSSGGNYPAITTEELKNLLIPIPDLETQTQIVSIFEKAYTQKKAQEAQAKQLLAGIDAYLLEKLGISETNLYKASSLIKVEEKRHFFVNFSQVQGKRFDPFYHQTEFDILEKALENGKYELKKIKHLCYDVRGVTYSNADEVLDNGLKILRANNISLYNNELDLSDIRYIRKDFMISENRLLQKDDIFMCAASGSKEHSGKVAYIEKDLDCYFGGFMMVLRCSNIFPKYLFEILASSIFRKFLMKILGGTNINNLNFGMFKNFEIPLPPLEVQQQIVDHISALHSEAKLLQKTAKLGIETAKKEVEKMILG